MSQRSEWTDEGPWKSSEVSKLSSQMHPSECQMSFQCTGEFLNKSNNIISISLIAQRLYVIGFLMSFWWCSIKLLPCCFCPSRRSNISGLMPRSVTLYLHTLCMLMRPKKSFSLHLYCVSCNRSATQRRKGKVSIPIHTSSCSHNEFCKKMQLWVMLSHVHGTGAHMGKVLWIIQLQFHINAAFL